MAPYSSEIWKGYVAENGEDGGTMASDVSRELSKRFARSFSEGKELSECSGEQGRSPPPLLKPKGGHSGCDWMKHPSEKGGIEGEWPLANLGWSKLACMTGTGV